MTIREREQEQTRPGPRPAAPAGAAEPRGTGLLGRLRVRFDDVVAEIKKITWPTRTETRNLTIVVIGISVLIGGLLGLVDLVLVELIKVLTGASG